METAIATNTAAAWLINDGSSSQEVLQQAARLAFDLSQRHNYKDIHRRVQDLTGRLGDSVLNIAVLGEFKRGKSSLINALLGANILPTAVIPTTSIVTAVKFGSVYRAHVEFKDGHRLSIPPEKISEYVTEDLNPHNQKKVNQVEIECPAELLSCNVRLIDTPGIGSIHLHNTQTTRSFLEETDAVLFVFSADQPATEAELSLLREISAFSVRTFLVQNKVDQLSQDELNASKKFLERAIIQEFQNQATDIYAVSARRVLEVTGTHGEENLFDFHRLRADFETFTVQERHKAFAKGAAGHLKRMLTKIEQQIQIDAGLLSASRSKLEDAIEVLQSAAKDISLSQELSAGYWISLEFKASADRLQEKLRCFCVEQEIAVQCRAQGTCLQHSIQDTLELWSREAEKEISTEFKAIAARFYNKAKIIAAPVNELVGELLQTGFHFDFEPADVAFVIDYKVPINDRLFQILHRLPLSSFLKELLIGKSVVAELKRSSRNVITDIRQQLEKKVQQFVCDFKAQVERFVEEIYESLTRAVQRQDLVAEKLAELKEMMSTDLLLIERMKNELDKLQ